MINIGVNENVYIDKLDLNDTREQLIITFKTKDEKVLSAFERLNAATHIEQTGGRDIRLFSPTPSELPDMTEEKKVDRAYTDVNDIKGQLIHLLKGYMTEEEASLGDLYAGIAMDADNYHQKMQSKEVLKMIFGNMVAAFTNHMKPFLGKQDPDSLFRLLLIRQSKDKPFPSLRRKYLNESPIWESMLVPKDASKVGFTAYEIKQGLDNADAPVKANADKPADAPSQSAEQLFAQGGVKF